MGISDGGLTSMALCWALERRDGGGIGLSSCDRLVSLGGNRYTPSPGMVPAAVTRSLGLDSHSGEIAGALSSAALDGHDLALGRWDGASVALTAVDWTDPDATAMIILKGVIGTVAIDGERFTAELSGAAARLDEPVCPATSPECRANFGDKQCRVDLAGRSITAFVVSATGGELTLDRAVDDTYLLGRLRYLSGANCGLATVVTVAGGTIVSVRDWPRAPVEPGCRIELREGCDKRFQTCTERFANTANFRGEPHLPGTDLLTRYPGS